jgi:hypothetical protein
MVYVIYSSDYRFDGVYENEDEAELSCRTKTIDTNDKWMVADLPYFKEEKSKIHYSEEDSEIDEAYYMDEIISLKEVIYSEKKKLKILEEFTNFFILLLVISIIYSSSLLIVLMLNHKY